MTNTYKEVHPAMREILKEMFRLVGAEYSDEFVHKDSWYQEYEWSEQTQEEFARWLFDYLRGNKEARKHFFKRTAVSNRIIKDTIGYFLFHCGWSFGETTGKREVKNEESN